MSTVDEVFARCAEEGRAAFIPFLMAGDPDLETTARLLEAMVAGGADIVELGVPWSDPIADGPTNQRAAQRALAAGTAWECRSCCSPTSTPCSPAAWRASPSRRPPPASTACCASTCLPRR